MARKKIPTNKEYLELVREWKKLDAEGKIRQRNKVAEKILAGLEHLIWSICTKRAHWLDKETREEALNEARLLIVEKVLPKFDEEKARESGARFSTYAIWWIRHAVTRLAYQDALVHTPLNKKEPAARRRAKNEEPEEKDYMYLPAVIYWDQAAWSQEGDSFESLMDFICAKHEINEPESPDDKIATDQVKKEVQKAIKRLKDKKERYVIRRRMEEVTLQQVGEEIGLTRERVRQIQKSAEKNIRKILVKKKQQLMAAA